MTPIYSPTLDPASPKTIIAWTIKEILGALFSGAISIRTGWLPHIFSLQTWTGDNGHDIRADKTSKTVLLPERFDIECSQWKAFRYWSSGDCPKSTRKVHHWNAERWTNQEVREYKTWIIDSEWEKLDANLPGSLRWRDFDNRKLQFRGETRPAARYLYFHYCLPVLRRAWKAGRGQKAVFSLKDELEKPFWETPGKYVCKSMLQAFVEELGHEYQDLMIGASRKKGGAKSAVWCGCKPDCTVRN